MKFKLWTEDKMILAEMAEKWKEKTTSYKWKGFKVMVKTADVWLGGGGVTWMWSPKTGLLWCDNSKAKDGIFRGRKKINFPEVESHGREFTTDYFARKGFMTHPDLYAYFMGWSVSATDDDIKKFIRGRMRGKTIAIHSITTRRYTDEVYKNWDWYIDQSLSALRRYAI